MEKEKDTKKPLDERTLTVVEEELQVGKRKVETGITRIRKKVHTMEQAIEEPLVKERVEIDRVPVNRYIDRPVEVRTEGEVTIIPLLEEVLVVEKRLLLKEEIHVRRHRETMVHTQKEAVRKEEAVVEHEDTIH